MKYLEELEFGDCFATNGQYFILTTDFKANGKKLCINLVNGLSQWIADNTVIDNIDIFTLDKDNNIIAFKSRKKTDVSDQT